ncbi:Uncharacterized conserved protein, DUF2252 family [Enhydrobacter aerosaccus]|uniref:Uncharacterized conserved protein, DUF2252 family n=1 Tax=Enhydrobacter aerosaccus TaxID=225324 RepID=A0A1T4L9J3_9HYPH|nr:DUF2252 domain-containing protein [Enhydrobacter aerosaccus]SJZ51452.1 Uncharacterized conserved protein, DUF2252 family [Enhydrobacter aerosaccus]
MNQVATDRDSSNAGTATEPQYRTADERRAEGKALREAAPREAHGHWKATKDRRDPIEILEESNLHRLPDLVPIRFGRMMQSPFAFYRGSAAVMAADLATTPVSGIRVQACGDAHLSNFGGFATPERRVIFDINDFDETLPGPWEWDLKRLVASIVLAGRHIRLPESDTARAVVATACSYREHMADYAAMRALDVWYDAIDVDRFLKEIETDETRQRVEERLKKVRAKNTPEFLFPKFVEHHGTAPTIADDPPLIFHPTADIAPGLNTKYREGFASYRDSLAEHVRTLFDRFHFCDLAMKVVGVGSVGTQCAIALFMASEDDPIFLQVKEANASVLEPYVGKSEHSHHGQRVVVGQRLMQSASDLFLGWGRGANGRDYYVRQMRDMKTSAIIEDFDAGDLRAYGRVCGWALARAHARSGDAAQIAGYMGSSEIFDDAMGDFATEYADQAQRDHRAFVKAIRQGRINAIIET